MRPRLTQLSLAVIMESTNIILVYCPPSRGLIQPAIPNRTHVILLPPIAGIDTCLNTASVAVPSYCPPLRGLIFLHSRTVRKLELLPPIVGIDTMPRAVSCSTAAPLPHSSIHPPHPLFAFPFQLSIQVRRLLRFENDYKKYI